MNNCNYNKEDWIDITRCNDYCIKPFYKIIEWKNIDSETIDSEELIISDLLSNGITIFDSQEQAQAQAHEKNKNKYKKYKYKYLKLKKM